MSTAGSNLAKAMLKSSEANVEMTVCFNPKELTVTKQVNWTPEEGATTDEPPAVFGKPSPASMDVQLQFDTYEEKVSVFEKYIQKLEKLTLIVDPQKGSKMLRPPLCIFVWGKFKFQGVVASLSQKYTMFLTDGTPVRCECALKLTKANSALNAHEGKEAAAKAAKEDKEEQKAIDKENK